MSPSITLFVPLSGRTACWRQYREFLLTVSASVSVKICDTSQSRSFHDMISRQAPEHWQIYKQTVGPQGLADWPRNPVRHIVQQAMCEIYQRMANELATDLVMVVEDDVFPGISFDELFEQLHLGIERGADSVTALYKSRFFADHVAWHSINKISGVVRPLTDEFLNDGEEFSPIGGSGFGCLLMKRIPLQEIQFEVPRYGWFDTHFFDRFQTQGYRHFIAKNLVVQHGVR